MRVDFIGIGAQKCASTWIHRVLSDHPEAAVYAGKEIDFFSTYYDRGYQWYEQKMVEVDGVKAVGEIATSYFANTDVPVRVAQYNPEMRIVLSLRDPIERAYSNHLHEVRLGHLTGQHLDFEFGLANNPMYLDQSRYAKHLARWLAVFPCNQLLVLFQEDIRDQPQTEAKKLYRFLGLAEGHRSWYLDKKINESRSVKRPGVDGLTRRVGKIGRAVGGAWLVDIVARMDFVRRLRRANQTDLRKIIPPMKVDTRALLQAALKDDMRELMHQLGRDSLPWPSWRML